MVSAVREMLHDAGVSSWRGMGWDYVFPANVVGGSKFRRYH
jgi:hypothetical protein